MPTRPEQTDTLSYITENEYRALLTTTRSNPDDRTARGAFADWLQEHGDDEEADRIRSCTPITLFSLATASGTFAVTADWVALLYPWPTPRVEYMLYNDHFPDFVMAFDSPYVAIAECAGHQIGLPQWDSSTEVIPDYAPEWNNHTNDNLNRRLLRVFLALCPDTCMRGLVDHFEQNREPFLERLELKRVLRNLMKAGEVKKLPDMKLVPAELKGLAR